MSWNFNSEAPVAFRFRARSDDSVWFVEFDAASVGKTFVKCTDQGPGNQIASVLLSGIDKFVQEYFGATEAPAKRARKVASSAAVVRENAELPLNLYLECVLGDCAERDRVRDTATSWFGAQHIDGGAPCDFLSTSGGRSVAKYRLWVFGRPETTMSLALHTTIVNSLAELADRQTWVKVCQRYRGDLPISALAGAPLDSSTNNASPQRVLDARAQLGAAAGAYVDANNEWRFPEPSHVLHVPLEQLVGGDGVRCNFLQMQPPLVQYGLTEVRGQHLVAHKLYLTDTLLARLSDQSPVGDTVARWLTPARRFSAQFGARAGDAALSPFANHLARQMALFDSALGAFRCHAVLLTALLASHTAYQPAARGLRVHVLLCGPFDQSKSFVMEKVAQLSVPNTVRQSQRDTLRVSEYEGSVRDAIKLIDELNDHLIAAASNSDAKAVFKSQLTTGEMHIQHCRGSTVSSRHDTKYIAYIAGTNAARAAIDAAIGSRFIVVDTARTAHVERRDGRHQTEQIERAGQTSAAAQRADLCNDAQCMQALVLLTEVAIADGTLADVTLSVLPHVSKAYAAALLERHQQKLGNRQYQQIGALTRTLAIHAAVHRLYTDARWPCRGTPLSAHHVLLLQPLLVDSVQLCCLALDLVLSHHVPAAHHGELMQHALHQLAVHPGRLLLCGHSAAEDMPYQLATRTLEPNAHANPAAELLDERAVSERLALVGIPATPDAVALFLNFQQ